MREAARIGIPTAYSCMSRVTMRAATKQIPRYERKLHAGVGGDAGDNLTGLRFVFRGVAVLGFLEPGRGLVETARGVGVDAKRVIRYRRVAAQIEGGLVVILGKGVVTSGVGDEAEVVIRNVACRILDQCLGERFVSSIQVLVSVRADAGGDKLGEGFLAVEVRKEVRLGGVLPMPAEVEIADGGLIPVEGRVG